jgi:hypothetical protein
MRCIRVARRSFDGDRANPDSPFRTLSSGSLYSVVSIRDHFATQPVLGHFIAKLYPDSP